MINAALVRPPYNSTKTRTAAFTTYYSEIKQHVYDLLNKNRQLSYGKPAFPVNPPNAVAQTYINGLYTGTAARVTTAPATTLPATTGRATTAPATTTAVAAATTESKGNDKTTTGTGTPTTPSTPTVNTDDNTIEPTDELSVGNLTALPVSAVVVPN